MTGASLCLGSAARQGWNNAGALWLLAGVCFLVFWYHREELQKATSRVTQLEDHIDTRRGVAVALKNTKRFRTQKRVTLRGRLA